MTKMSETQRTAIHAEALREDFRRRVAAARQDPETLRGTLGGVDMGSTVLAMLVEQDHYDAIKDDVVRAQRTVEVRLSCGEGEI